MLYYRVFVFFLTKQKAKNSIFKVCNYLTNSENVEIPNIKYNFFHDFDAPSFLYIIQIALFPFKNIWNKYLKGIYMCVTEMLQLFFIQF